MKAKYGIFIKVNVKSVASGVSVEDAEYIFLENVVSEERGKKLIEEAKEKTPNLAKYEEVKVVFPSKFTGDTIFFWAKSFMLSDDTAISTISVINKGIESFYRQKAIDILSEENPDEYVDKMMKVHDAGMKAIKKEAKTQFGTDITDDGEVDESATDLDSILDQIEGDLKKEDEKD